MAKLLAAESLFELARHSTEHCDTIFRCNGLNSLLVLLRTGSSFSQTRAAGALKAMLKDSQKRQAAFAEGVPFSRILCSLPSLSHTFIHSTPSRNVWHSSVRNPHSDQPQRVLLLCFLSLLRARVSSIWCNVSLTRTSTRTPVCSAGGGCRALVRMLEKNGGGSGTLEDAQLATFLQGITLQLTSIDESAAAVSV